ncbi:UNVERIFIED_CONTAM: hypothetical protein GTU68_063033 [Idotea baltica]|nr:hypothetical protein [Idotea baltica]
MTIRQVEESDIDQLIGIFEAYRVWYGKEADPVGARAFLSARIEEKDSLIYGAFTEGGLIVGFTQLYPLFTSTGMRRIWLLNDLFVDKEFRGQGISIMLIDRAKTLARETEAAAVILETQLSNAIGNKLYPRAGFELEEGINHYFWTTK